MPRVPETASLSEPTVQKVARGEVTPPKRRRRRRTTTAQQPTTQDYSITVHPAIKATPEWQNSHQSQREIRSATLVIIHNPGVPWPSRRTTD